MLLQIMLAIPFDTDYNKDCIRLYAGETPEGALRGALLSVSGKL